MMEWKWTKGPWECSGSPGMVKDTARKLVASVYGDDPDCRPDGRMVANARLIAQAPAMAEALESLLSVMEHCTVSAGCCMCGDDMEKHPMVCGHDPVDMGAYHADAAYKTARALLAAIKGG